MGRAFGPRACRGLQQVHRCAVLAEQDAVGVRQRLQQCVQLRSRRRRQPLCGGGGCERALQLLHGALVGAVALEIRAQRALRCKGSVRWVPCTLAQLRRSCRPRTRLHQQQARVWARAAAREGRGRGRVRLREGGGGMRVSRARAAVRGRGARGARTGAVSRCTRTLWPLSARGAGAGARQQDATAAHARRSLHAPACACLPPPRLCIARIARASHARASHAPPSPLQPYSVRPLRLSA